MRRFRSLQRNHQYQQQNIQVLSMNSGIIVLSCMILIVQTVSGKESVIVSSSLLSSSVIHDDKQLTSLSNTNKKEKKKDQSWTVNEYPNPNDFPIQCRSTVTNVNQNNNINNYDTNNDNEQQNYSTIHPNDHYYNYYYSFCDPDGIIQSQSDIQLIENELGRLQIQKQRLAIPLSNSYNTCYDRSGNTVSYEYEYNNEKKIDSNDITTNTNTNNQNNNNNNNNNNDDNIVHTKKMVDVQVGVTLMKKMQLPTTSTNTDDESNIIKESFVMQLHDKLGIGYRCSSTSESTTSTSRTDRLSENNVKQSNNDSGTGILIFISEQDRFVYISKGAVLDSILSNKRLDIIINQMKPLLRNGQYTEAILHALQKVEYYISIGEDDVVVVLDNEQMDSNIQFVLVVGLVGIVMLLYRTGAELQKQEYVAAATQLSEIDESRALALQGKFNCKSCPICLEPFIIIQQPTTCNNNPCYDDSDYDTDTGRSCNDENRKKNDPNNHKNDRVNKVESITLEQYIPPNSRHRDGDGSNSISTVDEKNKRNQTNDVTNIATTNTFPTEQNSDEKEQLLQLCNTTNDNSNTTTDTVMQNTTLEDNKEEEEERNQTSHIAETELRIEANQDDDLASITMPTSLGNCNHDHSVQSRMLGSDSLPLKLLRCGHVFDSTCWEEWVSTGRSKIDKCPICQQNVGAAPATITSITTVHSNSRRQVTSYTRSNDSNNSYETTYLDYQSQTDSPVPSSDAHSSSYLSTTNDDDSQSAMSLSNNNANNYNSNAFSQHIRERNFRLVRLASRYPQYIQEQQIRQWTQVTHDQSLSNDPTFVSRDPSVSSSSSSSGTGSSFSGSYTSHGGGFGGGSSGGGRGSTW